MTGRQLVLDPAFTFADLDARLTGLSFTRDASVAPVTPDVLPGEVEIAAWTRGGGRLTYTFNPVVTLRVLAAIGMATEDLAVLIATLPVLDAAAVGEYLTEPEARHNLFGLLAARAMNAGELALVVASLQAHPNPTVSRAAAETLRTLESAPGRTPREQTLVGMQILCRKAIPVFASLVGAKSESIVEAMRPLADDYPRVFRGDLVDRVRPAFEELWRTPPQFDRLVSGEVQLRVYASPAGMLRKETELSRHFPRGYRALAPYLVPERVWFVWRYLSGSAEAGMRYDGVVLLDDRWVWFPKPYVVAGKVL